MLVPISRTLPVSMSDAMQKTARGTGPHFYSGLVLSLATLLATPVQVSGTAGGLALLNLLAALSRLVAPPALLTLIIWFVIAFPFLLLERKASHRQLCLFRDIEASWF